MERTLLKFILALALLFPAALCSAQAVDDDSRSTVFVSPSSGLTGDDSDPQLSSDPFTAGSSLNSSSILANAAQGMMLFYPNPVTSQARIIFQYPSLSTIQIYVIDLRGQVMRSFSYAPGSYTLDLDMSTLATGLYNVRVIEGRTITNIKVIKE